MGKSSQIMSQKLELYHFFSLVENSAVDEKCSGKFKRPLLVCSNREWVPAGLYFHQQLSL